jgi:hypothetical protein
VIQPGSPPTLADVGQICAVADPVIRNLRITDCYARLAAAMARRTYACANWCTFATWASKQAGATIRGEDMLDGLRRELGQEGELLHPVQSLWRMLLRRGLLQRNTAVGRAISSLHTPFDAFQLASDAVAEGNLKVFEEIGLAFSNYLAQCPPDAPPESPEVIAFIDSLRPGPPPDGQGYLKAAFASYQGQRTVVNETQRAQLIVLANLQIGLHEQTRLQPQILAAMDSAVAGVETGLDLRLGDKPVDLRWGNKVAQGRLTEVSRLVITSAMMVLTLPGESLLLAENITKAFPSNLDRIDNPELRTLVAEYGALPPGQDDCGVTDWSVLDQRMRYISHLFRAYHEDPALAAAPFTAPQLADLERGVVPDGAV